MVSAKKKLVKLLAYHLLLPEMAGKVGSCLLPCGGRVQKDNMSSYWINGLAAERPVI